jgi:outer membrane protein assembly factor BamB
VISLPAPYIDESGFYVDFMSTRDGIFYLGEEGSPCSVLAFELTTATVLWRGEIDSSGGAIGSCPTVAGDMLIAGGQGAKSRLTGFHRLTGSVVWRRDVWSMYSKSPVIDGDRLYFKTDSMYCLDPATGRTIWTRVLSSFSVGSPAVDDASVYFVAGDSLFARDKRNGDPRWASADARHEGIAVDDARVYVSASQAIRAVDKSNGNERWRTPIADGKNAAYIDGNAFAIDDRFLVYAVWSNKDSVATLTCLDKSNGNERWTHIFPSEGCFAPTIAGGCVYVTTGDDNTFWALDVESGNVLIQDNSRRYGSAQPIVDDGILYVPSSDAEGRGFRLVAFTPRQSGARDAAVFEDLTIDVYPQPVTRNATVTVRLARSQELHLDLVDALGRRVTVIDEGPYAPGSHVQSFTLPVGAAAGVYYLRCASGTDVRLTPVLHLP